MDITKGRSPDDVLPQRYRFPTSSRRQRDNTEYKIINAFDLENLPEGWGQNSKPVAALIQGSWALLLRSYVRNDSISLPILFTIEDAGSHEHNGQRTLLNGENEALILQYQIADHCRLGDIHPVASKNCRSKDLDYGCSNAAIFFSSSLTVRKGHKDERLSSVLEFGKDVLEHDFDLVLMVGNSIADISISYRHPILSQCYAETVANTFRKIVETLVAHSELQVANLDIISGEQTSLILGWRAKDPFATMQETCMHHLVESKAREIPGAEAVCAWDGSLTYERLDKLSFVVAERLMRLGVGPGVYVPFACEKSMWTVVATLGILKAGGAFVPLNPKDPAARLLERLKEVQAQIVVTMEPFVPIFKDLVKHVQVVSANTICVNEPAVTCSYGKKLNGLRARGIHGYHQETTSPKDPIFVLFTSGSTGQPKGMIHEHRAICTHAVIHGKAMGYDGARVLQFAAHTFDVAIIDIFTTLIYGGCICIPSEEDRTSNIVDIIYTMKVDYAILTPSFAGLIEPSDVPTLKTLAIGGEPLPQDRIQRWAEKVKLIQIYGPAEVGICLTMDMQPSTPPETVGHPLETCSCWLVDPENSDRLVPIGAVGEMIIAGPTLARGYLNDEVRTQCSFIEAPSWADQLGLRYRRFYKTGDLLRYNVDSFDGSYDFVGRKDSQIKLRGQRIEPGEVEYHVGRLPGVAVSMVARPESGCYAGDLVAVVQMHRTDAQSFQFRNEPICLAPVQSLSIATVRRHLSNALPDYMIPTTCLVIDRMPFVPSLKIDRRQVTFWLTGLVSRPWTAATANLPLLGSNEATAKALSLKIARMVGHKDEVRRFALEGHDFRLQEAGIDSIQIISLSMFLYRDYSRKVPMNALLSSTMTIRELASLVDGSVAVPVNEHNSLPSTSRLTLSIDIMHELTVLQEDCLSIMDTQDSAGAIKAHVPIRNIFLTGATGYLGSAILQKLMSTADVHVYALVSCSTESAGLKRIIAAATMNGRWQDSYANRIHVWQGDLNKPFLGLCEKHLQLLRGTTTPQDTRINAIIHNGARVHYSSDYQTLKPTNVLSTIELLKITANSPSIATFVFISGGEKPHLDSSAAPPDYFAQLNQASGYTQTKFVSEQIVSSCVNHGSFQDKRLQIIKPGYIIGSPSNGIANQSDFIWRLIAGCIEIGAYNRDEAAHWLFIADVDRVARSVVSTVMPDNEGSTACRSGHIERLLDGLRFSNLWALLADGFGYRFEALEQEEWMTRLKNKIMETQENHMLFPLLHILERDGRSVGEKLEQSDEYDPGAVVEAVRKNVEYLIGVGFLPAAAKELHAEDVHSVKK
ncbi:hypothetical protein N7G274_003303 [Stereocaulon virgatum]|uniref:Uncharacterized protein n=1 Tax=Stereocaulon virgatum TaxID=373712 RepID=A0ABR4AD90_9LECA